MNYFLRIISATMVVCFISVSIAFAQERMITGTVLSGESAQPLPGVTVMIVGSTRGTTTDLDGKFSLNLREGDQSLRFSFIGYKTVTVTVGAQTVISISLEPDFETLEELVVIGYGVVRKSDLTGSVSSIKSEDITRIPAANPAQALQGKMAGVQVNSSTGAPGAQPVIRIRGVGTFNTNAPIFVVDGVILDDISFLTAADIESMEVLKDASAIAIYGSRGSNGVILITTKRGKEGKAVIQVNSEYSIQTVPNPISLLNGTEFATIVNEISPGSYNNVNAVPNTDWQALLFNPAPIQNHQVSASGSKEGLKYFFSVGYFNQTGIIDKSNFERLTIRANNEYQLNNFLCLRQFQSTICG
jgi:TonB-linked SusC/RagA family outer membrane protein